jgi:cytochrome c peroxidase
LLFALGSVAVLVVGACSRSAVPADRLRAALDDHGVSLLSSIESDPAMYELGSALFFDPILSGNKDVSCATCHEPALATTDDQSLAIGTGGLGRGERRTLADAFGHVPRNSPDLFNRGAPEWHTLFWDGRVQVVDGELVTPAGDAMPEGVSLQVAQALITIASPIEMRGFPGDLDVNGDLNELALLEPGNWEAIWAATMARLMAIEGYRSLFAAAFPDEEDLQFSRAVHALAAFQAEAFSNTASSFDQFLAGEDTALDSTELSGALLFYGEAGCATCHTGSLLTDQAFYSLATPQVGPGRGEIAPLDSGRGAVDGTGTILFRTPPLRNVAATAPYFHSGSIWALDDAVRHHLDPLGSLQGYDPSILRSDLAIYHLKPVEGALAASLSADIPTPTVTEDEIRSLIAFLEALSDPDVLALAGLIPVDVPSGLELYPDPNNRPSRES